MAEEPVAKSLDEIAAMMAEATLARQGGQPDQVTQDDDNADEHSVVSTDNDDDAGTEHSASEKADGNADAEHAGEADDAGSEDGVLEADGGESEDSTSEEAADEQADEQDSALASDAEVFEIDDDDLIELEGGEQVSIGELKKLHRAEPEMVQMVQEQTEALTEARVTRAQAVEEGTRAQSLMQSMFGQVEQVLMQPLVSEPPASLKTTNPEQYIRHLDAYQQDQARIATTQETIRKAIEEHAKGVGEVSEAQKATEFKLLGDKIPALRSQDKAERDAAGQDIIDSGEYYGFSSDEVNNAADHRLYRMAYDAMQYRKLVSGSGGKKVTTKEEKTDILRRQPRKLHSRGTDAKSRLSNTAKQRKVLRSVAKKTGSVDDVAALMEHNTRTRE